MTLLDYYSRTIPEYYPTMYQDGFTPEQIMIAHRKQMMEKFLGSNKTPKEEVKFTSEVIIK